MMSFGGSVDWILSANALLATKVTRKELLQLMWDKEQLSWPQAPRSIVKLPCFRTSYSNLTDTICKV